MECTIGIQCNDFVLLAADRTSASSIIAVKHDVNKIEALDDHLAMAVVGEQGDALQFSGFIKVNIQLYKIRNGFELSPTSASHYIQRNLANYLRSRTPYHVNLLIAGYDTVDKKAHLTYMDYLATGIQVPFGVHGYGAYFALGILDRVYKQDATVEEAVEMVRKCVAEIQKRLIVNLPSFNLVIIDKDGQRDLPDIVIDPVKLGVSVPSASTQEPVPMMVWARHTILLRCMDDDNGCHFQK